MPRTGPSARPAPGACRSPSPAPSGASAWSSGARWSIPGPGRRPCCPPRDALRSGDVWLAHSHRHREPERELVPAAAVRDAPRLAVPLNAVEWIADRRLALGRALEAVGRVTQCGPLAGGVMEGGRLRANRLEARAPAGADELVLDLHRRMPVVRITNLLMDTGGATGFTDAFADLRTGSVCRDRVGVLSVVLADGLNLGLEKVAASIATRIHWQLLRVARWHVEDDARRARARPDRRGTGVPSHGARLGRGAGRLVGRPVLPRRRGRRGHEPRRRALRRRAWH